MQQLENIEHYIKGFLEALIDYVPDLIGAILLLVIGWWVINLILGYVKKIFVKKEYDLALQKFILTFLEWSLKIILLIMVITQLGIETTSLLAALGAAGLAIGLALQGSLANLAGGVLIILLKPFRLGDWIEVQGISGSVKDISLFYTKLNTFGNQLAVIPNGEISNDNIVNYSGEGIRRDAITIRISYDSNIKLAKDTLIGLLKEQKDIMTDPAPAVVVSELAEYSVNLSVRFWAANEVFWDCHFYTLEEAVNRLEAAGITIAVPQRDVHVFPHEDEEGSDKRIQ